MKKEEDVTETLSSSNGDYPDGGWKAWSVVAGAWAISFVSWGPANSFGVYQTWYEEHQLSGETPDRISWIGSVQVALIFACGVLVGAAFDRGYLRSLLIAGCLCYAAGIFSVPYCNTYTTIFLAQGVACGLGPGIIFTPAVSTISHWFSKRRSLALGIFSSGSSVGSLVVPILLNNLMHGSAGFANAVRAAGGLAVGMILLGMLTIRTRLPPRKRAKLLDFTLFRDPAYSLFVLGAAVVFLGLYTPMVYIQQYALSNGLNPTLAYYSLAIIGGCSFFGRIIPNALADSLGPLTVLIPSTCGSALLIFLFIPMCKSNGGLTAFCVLFGFFMGTQVSMSPSCIASMTPPDKMDTIGIRTAMCFLCVSILSLFGTPISGALITYQNGSYVGAACAAGAFVLVAAVCMSGARVIVSRRKGTVWV